MKFRLSLVCGLVLLSPLGQRLALAESEVLERVDQSPGFWGKLYRRGQDEVAKLKIGTGLKLLDAELAEGVQTAIRYRLNSEPSYVNGLFSRYDAYEIRAAISPLDLIGDSIDPFGFSISSGTEILFVRQFKEQSKSLIALPYTFINFPSSSKRAIEKLKPGDFVAFKADLNLMLSFGHFSALFAKTIGPIATTALSNHESVGISGRFQVHVYRMEDNHIRVKLIADRDKRVGSQTKVGVDGDLKIFGIKILDRVVGRQAKRFLNLNLLDLSLEAKIADVFLVDYVFDLDNPEAAQAYDGLMGAKLKLKSYEIVNPTLGQKALGSKLFRDLTEVEKIFTEDRDKELEARRVDRIFRGSASATSFSGGFKFGLNLLRFEMGNYFASNRVLNFNRNNQPQHFVFETSNPSRGLKIAFGLYGNSERLFLNMLAEADPEFNPTRFLALSTTRQKNYRSFSKADYEELISHFKKVLPEAVFQKIRWPNWDFSKGNIISVGLNSNIYLPERSLGLFQGLQAEEMRTRMVEFVHRVGIPYGVRALHSSSQTANSSFAPCSSFECISWDLRWAAKHLERAFDPQLEVSERMKSFWKVRNYPIFQELGAGLLVSMVSEEALAKALRVTIDLGGRGVEPLHFEYGKFDGEDLYQTMLYIQNVLNDRSFDLRLYRNSKGELKGSAGRDEKSATPYLRTQETP